MQEDASKSENSQQSWSYHDEGAGAFGSSKDSGASETVSWSASEYIAHDKDSAWYVIFAVGTILASAIIYLLTRDIITTVVVVVAAILFGITASKKPRTMDYRLDTIGVHIGDKSHSYHHFKSFSILSEGAFNSVTLIPLKRFSPPISLYYPPEDEQKIITKLSMYLPHEIRRHDPIDRLMRKVRF